MSGVWTLMEKKNIYIYIYYGHSGFISICISCFFDVVFELMGWVWPPPRIPVANEGLREYPTKHVIILVVPVAGRGPHPIYLYTFWQDMESSTFTFATHVGGACRAGHDGGYFLNVKLRKELHLIHRVYCLHTLHICLSI